MFFYILIFFLFHVLFFPNINICFKIILIIIQVTPENLLIKGILLKINVNTPEIITKSGILINLPLVKNVMKNDILKLVKILGLQ